MTAGSEESGAPARLTVVEGDITGEAVDAVVNAANGALKRGGGVDGAIHRAAGPELQTALDRFGGCPTGECRVTPGFRLKARAIIHCVGPVWRGGGTDEEALLAACYRNALEAAAARGCAAWPFRRSAPASMVFRPSAPPKSRWRRCGGCWPGRWWRGWFPKCASSALTPRPPRCTVATLVPPDGSAYRPLTAASA